MHSLLSADPVPVSEYISILNEALSQLNIKIIGEVSEMKVAASGHIYFSLKDEKTGDIINCAIWNSIYRMCGVKIENGMQIILSGNADIYRARGTLTFKVKTIELVGEGALKKAYEDLKKKLFAEGLFDDDRKKSLPMFPKRIGVITSKKGAAIHDFINNLGKFGFKIYICDSRVEGQEAVSDLLRSINIMKKKELDVLVIIRGGGSLQSLMAFDNEMLVRSIANFPVPVIAGIGHHEDIPLVSLASDVSQSTPTAVANYLGLGFQKAKEKTINYNNIIYNEFQKLLYKKKDELYLHTESIKNFFYYIFSNYEKDTEKVKRFLSTMINNLQYKKETLFTIKEKIKREFYTIIINNKKAIKNSEEIITAYDPRKQLKLGYAIIQKKGKTIKSIFDIKKGEKINTILYDGKVESQVEKIIKK